MKDYKSIEVDIDEKNRLAIIYFNRPMQLNAFNIEFLNELISAFKEISESPTIRCLILIGRGKAFCAGGDVVDFQKAEVPNEFMAEMVGRLHNGIIILKNMKQLTIAAINGACFGAGLGYAMACDFRICSERATFGCAFTRIGLSPDSSSTYYLPKLVGMGIASEMFFLHRILNAEQALKFNLVNKVVSSEIFMEEIKKLSIELIHGAPMAFTFTKKLLRESYSNDLESHLNREAEYIIKTAETEDFQEGLKAFFEKRNPDFNGK